jgi:predicted TIM-barrel fold metal-dependent hydrolase
MEKYFNAHAHCFTIDHVPENFFDELIGGKRFLRISRIKKSGVLRFFIRAGTSAFARWVVKWFSPITAKKLKRLRGLINYSLEPSQQRLVDRLDEFYKDEDPAKPEYRHVLLTMDMEYMAASSPGALFDDQINEISNLKRNPHYKDKVFPFVFADPRRNDVTEIVREKLTGDKLFQGIKLYPALGYYPFDRKLLDIYKFAQENEVPLITHCIIGDVYYRDNYWETPGGEVHPITGQTTIPVTNKLFKSSAYKDPSMFQHNFTHPLNWECLLNPVIASNYFNEPVDLSNLKICIGHFGGEDEWGLYKKQEKKKNKSYQRIYAQDVLDINQRWLGSAAERYNWLTIIKALLQKYPNVYADISFTLHEEKIYPVLKEMLSDDSINKRILFGTDYYVNATEAEENVILEILRRNLFEKEIKMISYDNPVRFLSSKLSAVN